ncbi:MAG TPA: electron transfer flavoprotein subunit alpha/FixB family protein [Kineosporiaceae bacterium]
MSEVLVIAERTDGGVRKPTLELLTLARRLGEPSAVLFGPADAAVVDQLGEFGARKVYLAQDPAIGEYLVVPKVDVVSAVAQRVQPAAVLLTSSAEGKDVAGRVAVRLGSGIITDAVDVRAGSAGLEADQSVVAGEWLATSRIVRGIPVVTVMPNAVTPEPAPVTAVVEPADVEFGVASRSARIVNRAPKTATGRPELADAAVIVSGGRGVGSADGFTLIEHLADALGAAVGASRAATDEQWYPHEFQVGQTGKTVAPQLYLATGISGAIQHRAGMQGSKTVVAINKDPKAPIFSISDFGVVGDLHVVIPQLIDEISKRTS